MSKSFLLTLCGLFMCSLSVFAEESVALKNDRKEIPKEEAVSTLHSVKINNTDISYKATVGMQLLNDDKSNPKASLFYIAYTKEGVTDLRARPITFCFNGGPGSSSVWLHLGVFGPRRIDIDSEGKQAVQPYHLLDNPYSLLDVTDLVFIDPVSTGYSRAVDDAKPFHGVEGDIQSVADFIRLYVTRNLRWESPKFLAGESYGTTRAAGLAQELHDNQHLYIDGIILISSVLDFQTIKFSAGNDLPYVLFLPTYTATALYHNKLAPNLQQDKQKTLTEAEKFANNEYACALMQGDRLQGAERAGIIDKLAGFTGLSKEYIDRSNLRVHYARFAKELLQGERRTVGRFDSRIKGIESDWCNDTFDFDPSFESVIGVFAATLNNYVRAELNWKSDTEYKILSDVSPWDYGKTSSNQYLNVGEKLMDAMTKNTKLQVFVGTGYYDLATPYFATEYTFSHLGLDPSLRKHVVLKNYEGGHMMYLYHPSLVELKSDLVQFFKQSLQPKP